MSSSLDCPVVSFLQLICSYVLYPFAYVMGIEKDDCHKVGELIGIKTFLNEFLAYTDLSKWISNTADFAAHAAANGTCIFNEDDIYLVERNQTLIRGILSVSGKPVPITMRQCTHQCS